VDEKLGIAIRTANRWASWYEAQLPGTTKPKRENKSTSGVTPSPGHVAETPLTELADEDPGLNTRAGEEDRPEPRPDEPLPHALHIMLTAEQKAEFEPAWNQLGDAASDVVFRAVVAAANDLTPESVQ
jgi:hypothetical protein